MLEMKQQGLISQRRYEMLVNNKWNYDLIIHEAGVPPIHTPVSTLANLPKHVYILSSFSYINQLRSKKEWC